MRKDVLKIARAKVKAKHVQALKNADLAWEKALAIPEIAQNFDAYKTLEYDKIKAETFGIKSNLDKEIKSAKDAYLKSIEKYGFKESDFDVKYDCPKCHDSGVFNNAPCDCVIKTYYDLLNESVSNSGSNSHTVDDFIVIDENDKKHLDFVKTVIDKFPTKKTLNFVFNGCTGVGKTFMASCIANGVSEKGYSVIFLSAFEIIQKCLKYHTLTLSEREGLLDDILECDLLVIDDLGTEAMLNNVTIEYLLLILSERIAHAKHTIITTNLSDDMINKRYGERFFSRLLSENYSRLKTIDGKDKRIKKSNAKTN